MRNHLVLSGKLPSLVLLILLASSGVGQDPLVLEGRVVDLQGRPIEGCTISTDPGTPDGYRETKSDAEGRYTLETVRHSYEVLRFSAPAHCTTHYQHWMRSTDDGPVTRVPTVAVPPAVTMAGRVRNQEGGPIAGATVTMRDLVPSELRIEAEATTDEQGIFLLRSVPDSPLELTIEADGYSPARLLPVGRSSPLDVRLDDALTCTGMLLDHEGLPLAGRLALAYEDGESIGTRTEEDGQFHFTVRPGLRYRLSANDPALRSQVRSEILQGSAQGVELRMSGGEDQVYLELVVVEAETAEPVQDFESSIGLTNPHSDSWGNAYAFYSPRSGTKGTLRIPVDRSWEPGRGTAIVRAPGRGEVFATLERPEEEQKLIRARIEMPPERSVSGTVVDADGAPVQGARVWPFIISNVAGYSRIPPFAVTTDAEGHFRLGSLAERDYVINAAHPLFPEIPPVRVSLADGGVKGLSLSFPKPSQLEIHWKNAPERGDWWIDLYPELPTQRGRDRLPSWSGSEGRVIAPLQFDQPLKIDHAAAEAFSASVHHLTVSRVAQQIGIGLGEIRLDGRTTRTLDLSEAQMGRIVGRVSTSSLVGIGRLMVRALNTRSSTSTATLPDRDGSFALDALSGNSLVEVVDILTGVVIATSEEFQLRPGEQVESHVEVEVGVLDVTVQLPKGETRTAMKVLVLRHPGQRRGARQIPLADLRGNLRFVLPPGETRIGFQRAKGKLGPQGSARYVDVGFVTAHVLAGKITPFVLQEPPRLSTEELASEVNR